MKHVGHFWRNKTASLALHMPLLVTQAFFRSLVYAFACAQNSFTIYLRDHPYFCCHLLIGIREQLLRFLNLDQKIFLEFIMNGSECMGHITK